ncbi:anhydro-N-acetylmuramic acid kinase [Halioxenophilus aromaticivorans]|uniref:Anhydro-N-acetylmuramic acid kinase n=1 Tax=Halioxenophilus aromaticivorans TaxID=1306992 RepID=A0AAV3U3D4_9ALTE
MTELYIGLMSGTSIDSIDAALISVNSEQITLLDSHSHTFPPALKQHIHHLCHADQASLDLIGACDREIAEHFAKATLALLAKSNLTASDITAIGSHGQTIRHRPSQEHQGPFTWQLGDPNIIAFKTGITTVADFRRMDMAAGGQAAPLAPIFHQALFGSGDVNRSLCNVGGISNVTWLPASGEIKGFDLGPGNALMDCWINHHRQQPFDANGQWAAGGTVLPELLARFLQHPFLLLPPPKSTGREEFHLHWVNELVSQLSHEPSPQDVQATLLEFTAQSIVTGITQHCPSAELYICGGGAHNGALMTRLNQLLPGVAVGTTDEIGIAADWVEACGFAWLAHQRMHRLPGSHTAVTGAAKACVLGGIYVAGV